MSRSYAVGIPVAVTVHDDGRVDLDFDLSGLEEDIDEEHALEAFPGTTITFDQLTVSAAADTVGRNITYPIIPPA